MEFITVKQFKKQPVEVQEVFLDWWECKPFDIYAWTWNSGESWEIKSCEGEEQLKAINEIKDRGLLIPLFTEGQLRKFIEDKGYKIVKIELINGQYDIYTEYKAIDNYSDIWLCDELGEDLLQAYWKVACSVAKEVN